MNDYTEAMYNWGEGMLNTIDKDIAFLKRFKHSNIVFKEEQKEFTRIIDDLLEIEKLIKENFL